MGGGNCGEFDEFCVDLDAVLWVGWWVIMGDLEGGISREGDRGDGVGSSRQFGEFKMYFYLEIFFRWVFFFLAMIKLCRQRLSSSFPFLSLPLLPPIIPRLHSSSCPFPGPWCPQTSELQD